MPTQNRDLNFFSHFESTSGRIYIYIYIYAYVSVSFVKDAIGLPIRDAFHPPIELLRLLLPSPTVDLILNRNLRESSADGSA